MDQKLASIFGEAQVSAATHRKYITLLKRIQLEAYESEEEELFNQTFFRMVNKVLPIRKGEPSADRIIKLIGEFVQAIVKDKSNGDSEMTMQFTDQLVRHILRGIEARDKNVRYRVCQLLSRLLHHMTFLEIDLHESLSELLYERLHDKETTVRTQAAICIARLQNDDAQSGEEMSEPAKHLLVAMENDASPEVRRAAMLNLEISPSTFPNLVQRARDVNTTNRRIFFSRLMSGLNKFRGIENAREQILSWGLHDREETVRKAAAKMFGIHWMKSVDDDVIGILERMDVVESEIAERAMHVMFQLRPDVVENVCLTDVVWRNLTTEVSLLVRTLYDHLCENNLETVMERNFGDTMELAALIKHYLGFRKNNLRRLGVYFEDSPEPPQMTPQDRELEAPEQEGQTQEHGTENESDQNLADADMANTDQESTEPFLACDVDFTVHQLMLVAVKYDYSDEIGRREMLQILRSSLSKEKLNDELTKTVLQVLRKISISEKDFMQIVIEIITDIRDWEIDQKEMDVSDSDSFHSAADEFPPESQLDEASNKNAQTETAREVTPKEAILQCLMIAQHMLEIIDESMHNNMVLVGLMNTLFTPAVRSKELDVREAGLKCLGLCCLLNKALTTQYLQLFAKCAKEDELVSRLAAIRVICDILALHGASILDLIEDFDPMSIAELFHACMADDSEPQVQAAAAEGLFKLYLADIFGDDMLFETLIFAFFNGSTSENDELKQCLSFCIPTYAFSRTGHQDRLVRIAPSTLLKCFENYDTFEDKSRVQSHGSMVQNFVFWTDASNIPNIEEDVADASATHIKLGVHLMDMALQLRENKAALKAVVTSLSKLVFTYKAGMERLNWMSERLEVMKDEMHEKKFVLDFASRNAVVKLERNIKAALNKCEAVRNEEATGNLSKIKEESDSESKGKGEEDPVGDENANKNDENAAQQVVEAQDCEAEAEGEDEDGNQDDAEDDISADKMEDGENALSDEDEIDHDEDGSDQDEDGIDQDENDLRESENEIDEHEEVGSVPKKRPHSDSGNDYSGDSDVDMESS